MGLSKCVGADTFGHFEINHTSILSFLSPDAAHLYLTDDVGQPFAACVFALDRLVGDSVGDDGKDFWEIGVVWSEDDGVVAVEGRESVSGVSVSFRWFFLTEREGGGVELPFDEVTQEVERVDGLLFVLVERQPAEPMLKDLVDVYALRPEPRDLPHRRDAVLRGVDVLLGTRVCRLDDSEQQRDGLWTGERDRQTDSWLTSGNKPVDGVATSGGRCWNPTCAKRAVVLSSILGHDADTIGGRLPDLGTRVAQRLQHGLQEVLGVLEGGGAAVLHHVVKDAQTPLSVSPRPVGKLNASRV